MDATEIPLGAKFACKRILSGFFAGISSFSDDISA
jgi:hypothetical protein